MAERLLRAGVDHKELDKEHGGWWHALSRPSIHAVVVRHILRIASKSHKQNSRRRLDPFATYLAAQLKAGRLRDVVCGAARMGRPDILLIFANTLSAEELAKCVTRACKTDMPSVVRWALRTARAREIDIDLFQVAFQVAAARYNCEDYSECADTTRILRWLCSARGGFSPSFDQVSALLYRALTDDGDVGCALWIVERWPNQAIALGESLIESLARCACSRSSRSFRGAPTNPATLDRLVRFLDSLAGKGGSTVPRNLDLWPLIVASTLNHDETHLALDALRYAALRAAAPANYRAREAFVSRTQFKAWNGWFHGAPDPSPAAMMEAARRHGAASSCADAFAWCFGDNQQHELCLGPRTDGRLTASDRAWARWCRPVRLDPLAVDTRSPHYADFLRLLVWLDVHVFVPTPALE